MTTALQTQDKSEELPEEVSVWHLLQWCFGLDAGQDGVGGTGV